MDEGGPAGWWCPSGLQRDLGPRPLGPPGRLAASPPPVPRAPAPSRGPRGAATAARRLRGAARRREGESRREAEGEAGGSPVPPLLRVPDWSRGGGDGARGAGAEGTEVRDGVCVGGRRDRARLLGLGENRGGFAELPQN